MCVSMQKFSNQAKQIFLDLYSKENILDPQNQPLIINAIANCFQLSDEGIDEIIKAQVILDQFFECFPANKGTGFFHFSNYIAQTSLKQSENQNLHHKTAVQLVLSRY